MLVFLFVPCTQLASHLVVGAVPVLLVLLPYPDPRVEELLVLLVVEAEVLVVVAVPAAV